MNRVKTIAVLSALASLSPAVAGASGVGLQHYNPTQALPGPHGCTTGDCGPGGCGRGGVAAFAGVDGATPPPCAAEGACFPKYSTFGFYRTNWRRWPGDADAGRTEPAEATAGDELLAPFDAPPPEREDQQAPPPIDEDPGATIDDDEDELPPLDIDLPPLPERRPFNRPFEAPPEDDNGPPDLPFGAVDRDSPAMTWRPADASRIGPAPSRRLPDFPADVPEERSRSLAPRTAVRGEDAPPPLPGGFTLIRSPEAATGAASQPTLGRPQARFDAAVRQATAIGPAGSSATR